MCNFGFDIWALECNICYGFSVSHIRRGDNGPLHISRHAYQEGKRIRELLLRLSGILVMAVAAYLFISAISQGLKPFEYAVYPVEDSLARNETEIARGVSRYLWNYRSIDVIALAFLLVIATACCVLFLGSGVERRRRN